MYQPRNTRTPGFVKLEIKGPAGKRKKTVVLEEAGRNRMVGQLRYFLDRAGIRAVAKPMQPKQWIGLLFEDRQHDGPVQKRVRSILASRRSRTVKFGELAKALGRRHKRGNVLTSLRSMQRIGDVRLTTRNGRVSGVQLVDYST
jgi:hypothetical protein